MSFITAHYTKKGEMKQENQDALMIKTAQINQGNIGLFVVCDGMGGIGGGEIASSLAITELSNWFVYELPNLLSKSSFEEISTHLVNRIKKINQMIIDYGKFHHINCGTTLTAILIKSNQFYTFQIGDSRAYLIGQEVRQLTTDQSLVARELERGAITPEEVPLHPERHVILQCLGIQPVIEVVTTTGTLSSGECILLCTDGFYHQVTHKEIQTMLNISLSNQKEAMKEYLQSLTKTIKQREETDDITSILIKLN